MAHVVVIDDDPVLRRVIALALEAAGHSVLRCEHGRKAVDFLAHDHADLLITDILMPEMDGIETLREVRRLRPDLPIVAISGGSSWNPTHFLGFAQAFGANAVLAKPFAPADLIELAAKLLEDPTPQEQPDG
jgi:CheY-like chemotaxis protein